MSNAIRKCEAPSWKTLGQSIFDRIWDRVELSAPGGVCVSVRATKRSLIEQQVIEFCVETPCDTEE